MRELDNSDELSLSVWGVLSAPCARSSADGLTWVIELSILPYWLYYTDETVWLFDNLIDHDLKTDEPTKSLIHQALVINVATKNPKVFALLA